MRQRTFALFALGLLASSLGAACSPPSHEVAIMLPMSGDNDHPWEPAIQWALESVSSSGVLEIEPRWVDLTRWGKDYAVEQVLSNDEIKAVVGPSSSTDTYKYAPYFIDEEVLMVSPSSPGADVYRAFHQYNYIWRTTENDLNQVKAILVKALQRHEAEHEGEAFAPPLKVALITSQDSYGHTFFDWMPFFARELGIEMTHIERYDEDENLCDTRYQFTFREAVNNTLASGPDLVVMSPSEITGAVCLGRYFREAVAARDDGAAFPEDVRAFWTDASSSPGFIAGLGDLAEGFEGIRLGNDTQNGWAEAYEAREGKAPPQYAANSYDAVMLIAYALAFSKGQGGFTLNRALEDIAKWRGSEDTDWDEAGMHAAMTSLSQGQIVNPGGATGSLDFDEVFPMELESSTYVTWHIEDGAFVVGDALYTGADCGEDQMGCLQATFYDQASTTLIAEEERPSCANIEPTDIPQLELCDQLTPPDKNGLWALIVAVSSGWGTYRHQADALAQYQLLRNNGVPDHRIVLAMADDIASAPENLDKGAIRNDVGGQNLYYDLEIDYDSRLLTSVDIMNILSGEVTETTPTVIESTETSNVYVYFVGHGGGSETESKGLYVNVTGLGLENDTNASLLSPVLLRQTLKRMNGGPGVPASYRRMLMVVEACRSGWLGEGLITNDPTERVPRVLVMTAADVNENSFGRNYDPDLGQFLADEFSYEFLRAQDRASDRPLTEVYEDVYKAVNGSHVQLYNMDYFAPAEEELTLDEFLTF
jgi:ABC-type branched-subunit amino acid transport system substrate-binding protein